MAFDAGWVPRIAVAAAARPGRQLSLPAPPRRSDEYAARSIPPDGTIREAARIMVERGIGALLVRGGEPQPTGIVTERDLLRATTDPRIDPDATPVSSVMSAPVHAMAGDELLYRALGRMDRLGVRHLCVADATGAALGMVSQRICSTTARAPRPSSATRSHAPTMQPRSRPPTAGFPRSPRDSCPRD